MSVNASKDAQHEKEHCVFELRSATPQLWSQFNIDLHWHALSAPEQIHDCPHNYKECLANLRFLDTATFRCS